MAEQFPWQAKVEKALDKEKNTNMIHLASHYTCCGTKRPILYSKQGYDHLLKKVTRKKKE